MNIFVSIFSSFLHVFTTFIFSLLFNVLLCNTRYNFHLRETTSITTKRKEGVETRTPTQSIAIKRSGSHNLGQRRLQGECVTGIHHMWSPHPNIYQYDYRSQVNELKSIQLDFLLKLHWLVMSLSKYNLSGYFSRFFDTESSFGCFIVRFFCQFKQLCYCNYISYNDTEIRRGKEYKRMDTQTSQIPILFLYSKAKLANISTLIEPFKAFEGK